MEVETGERHFLSGEEQRRSRVQTIPLATSAPTGSRDHISGNAGNLKYMEVTNSILSLLCISREFNCAFWKLK